MVCYLCDMHLPAYKGLKILMTLALIAAAALLLNRLVPLAPAPPPSSGSVDAKPSTPAPAFPSASPVADPSLPIQSVAPATPPEVPAVAAPAPEAPPATSPEISIKQLKWKSELWYLNGQLFTGVAVDAHPGGKPRIRWPMRDGRFHGVIEEWYPNGQRSTETHYAHGLHEGANTYWNEDGTLQVKKIWKQDTLLSEEKPQ